jgi:hypothetical protein
MVCPRDFKFLEKIKIHVSIIKDVIYKKVLLLKALKNSKL